MRRVVEALCWLAHRLWWVPVWNRSAMLTCPINWASGRFEKFERWYWK